MMLKPISPDMVEAMIKRHLPQREHRIRG
jgi:hypothetical protein